MKKRNSSIEMLRIIAMLMIVMGHLSGHGVLNVNSSSTFEIWRGGAESNKIFSVFLIPGGRVGVALFFMITGYFQVKKPNCSIKKVVIETFFYSVAIQFFALIFHIGSLGTLIRTILPLSSNSWWFVSSYVVLMLCSSVINGYYLKLSKRKKQGLLVIAWLFLYTIPYLFQTTYYSLERGVLFYLIGAYIRTEIKFDEIHLSKKLLAFLFCGAWILYVPLGYVYYSGYSNNKIYSMIFEGIVFNGGIVIICATTIFLLFNLIKPFENLVINMIAKSTFGVYLLHDNMYRSYLWHNIFEISIKFQNNLFPVIAVGIVLLIFFICVCIDYLREKLFELIGKHVKILN